MPETVLFIKDYKDWDLNFPFNPFLKPDKEYLSGNILEYIINITIKDISFKKIYSKYLKNFLTSL